MAVREETGRLTVAPRWQRIFPNREWWLLVALALEILFFGQTGVRFATVENSVEIVRLAVELGLLAIALTPIIVSGGIDLSVGSNMGLAAIFCGWLWHDQGWPIWGSVAATLILGLVLGGFNSLLIGWLRLPPLIVTLGTFSLFRGIAEGLSGGSTSYNGFPAQFLLLGQGYIGGWLPPQSLIFALAIIAYALLLHRTIFGRALYAIGCSPDGARHAGIPVSRRLGLVYLLAGLVSSLAAVVYIAHLGQARSDAGTGYELMAITAVVLGGTSIFGGRGTILGTILGLLAIVVLQNGMRLSGQSPLCATHAGLH